MRDSGNLRAVQKCARFFLAASAGAALLLLVIDGVFLAAMIRNVVAADGRWSAGNAAQIARELTANPPNRKSADWCARRIESDAGFLRMEAEMIVALDIALLGSLSLTAILAYSVLRAVRRCLPPTTTDGGASCGDVGSGPSARPVLPASRLK